MAKKEDHIKLGKQLDLFHVDSLVGKGLPLLLPKGTTIKRILERFIQDEEIRRGYQRVSTPILGKLDLYKTSGHWPHYKNDMYPPIKIDGTNYILRPMSCPHHFMIYKSRSRSYKDLPLRLAELAMQYRKEKSGELRGLMRVRGFELADAHIFCTPEQLKAEFKGVLDLIKYGMKALGFKGYWFRLSLRDKKKEKFIADEKLWNKAEKVIKECMKESKTKYVAEKGQAAFYGPKLDIQMKNIYGKEDTLFTVQVDFALPKRFKLQYRKKDNTFGTPVVIHRSSIGAIERTIGFLIEYYQGAFPLWLSPVQVKVITFTDRNAKYAQNIAKQLEDAGFRIEVDDRTESVQKKVRDAEIEKIPYILVCGDKEQKAKTIAVRKRSVKGVKFGIKVPSFIKQLQKEESEFK